jgi:hypothetical protein
VFKINGKPIEMVNEFKYLGQIVTQDDNNETAVTRNIVQAREKWASMRRFLIVFYRTVILSVLLYGSESWVLTTDMMRQLRSFHRRCCHGITGDFIHQDEESGEWICPSSKEEVLEKAGILTVEEYIQRERDTILPYARSTNIYGRCKNAKKLGSNLLWWEVNYYSSNDAAEV